MSKMPNVEPSWKPVSPREKEVEVEDPNRYEEEAYNPNEEGQHVFQSLSPDYIISCSNTCWHVDVDLPR